MDEAPPPSGSRAEPTRSRVQPFRFRIEPGHLTQFARAIGDANPAFVEGRAAPPTFAMAAEHAEPDYDRRPRNEPGAPPWFGSGREPIGSREGVFNRDGGSGFHAEQIFEYHRPLRPGEEVTVETRPGATWTKEGRRGGTLTFTETIRELRGADGELVLTARFIGVGTEKRVE